MSQYLSQDAMAQTHRNSYTQAPNHQNFGYAPHNSSGLPSIVTNDGQLHYGNPHLVAELPAPLPPAPPTSTPAAQLNEDELLAHKLQQMEVAEAQARPRSNSNISDRNSLYDLPPSPSTSSTLVSGHHQLQPRNSPSVGNLSIYGSGYHVHAPHHHLSPLSPANLAPEVVPPNGLPPLPPRPTSSLQLSNSLVQPTAHLPPAPQDPVELAKYLEIHRQVPYPPQWNLPSVVATFYESFTFTRRTTWLDPVHSVFWRNVRFSENARNPVPPVFKLQFYARGGHIRDPRLTWIMTNPAAPTKAERNKELWRYDLRLDLTTQERKSENLRPSKGRDIMCTYLHASNYDTFNFIGIDGRRYKWVTHGPVSSVHGARYDTLRHALFVSTERFGDQDPLYGQIVADHTYWDGHVDHKEVHEKITCSGCTASPLVGLRWKCKTCPSHDSCDTCRLTQCGVKPSCKFTLVSLPDEALYIRSQTVDITMVIATLQILKDWEKYTMQRQKFRDPKSFAVSENAARSCDLGRMRYFRAQDFDRKPKASDDGEWDIHGTMVAALECAKSASDNGGSHVGFASDSGFSSDSGSSAGSGSSSSFSGDSGGSSSSSSGGGSSSSS